MQVPHALSSKPEGSAMAEPQGAQSRVSPKARAQVRGLVASRWSFNSAIGLSAAPGRTASISLRFRSLGSSVYEAMPRSSQMLMASATT